MARHRLISPAALWQKHENIFTEIFLTALKELTQKKIPITGEDAISEQLSLILRNVCFRLVTEQGIEIREPEWERPITPVYEVDLKGGKKLKRPDFTCTCFNRFAGSPSDLYVPLHVECKMLGKPTSRTWILNKNYVINGIKRFDSITHEYGKRAISGMMIGYVIDMPQDDTLKEVNTFQGKYLPDNPVLEFVFGKKKISDSFQYLSRKNVCPKQFKLIHLWADLDGSVKS